MQDNREAFNEYKKEYESVSMSNEAFNIMKERMSQAKKENAGLGKIKAYKGWLIGAAAAISVIALPNTSGSVAYAMGNIPVLGNFFKVVTFRDYQYEGEYNVADVTVPEITTVETEGSAETAAAEKSAEEINAEIKTLSEKWISEFETTLSEEGYKAINVESEVISTSDKYFTLKLSYYEVEASGYEENHYYTIDLNTGERLALKDIFVDGSNYADVISENIRMAMDERRAADEEAFYWIHDEETEDFDLKAAVENAGFYVKSAGTLVICFNEGEVAPMYMGAQEFEISADKISAILK